MRQNVEFIPAELWKKKTIHKTKSQYPVLCAWCLSAGVEKIIGYSEIEHSHGICQECFENELATLKKEKPCIKQSAI